MFPLNACAPVDSCAAQPLEDPVDAEAPANSVVVQLMGRHASDETKLPRKRGVATATRLSSSSSGSCVTSALSVGISNYASNPGLADTSASSASWPQLAVCLAEAKEFRRAVREHHTDRIWPAFNVDRDSFWDTIEDWIEEAEDGGTHLFFFSGHGYEFDGDFYLVPKDSKNMQDNLKLTDIMNKVDQARQGCTIAFFLAALRSSASEEVPVRSRSPRSEVEWRLERHFRSAVCRNDYLISFACEPCQIAAATEDDGSGVACGLYVRSLLSGLARDANISDIMALVRREVGEATNNCESPWHHSTLQETFGFFGASSSSKGGCNGEVSASSSDALKIHRGSYGSNTSDNTIQDIRCVWRTRIDRLADPPRRVQMAKVLLLTDTEGQSHQERIAYFRKTGIGAHLLLHRDGCVTQLVHEDLCAWCGQVAFWGGLEHSGEIPGIGRVNEVHNYSVSIALEGDGTKCAFTEKQYEALIPLASQLLARFEIEPWDVVGLSEVCMPPGSFTSPGPFFEWSRLSQHRLALTACSHANVGGSGRGDGTVDVDELRALMGEWGYACGVDEQAFDARVQCFRARYLGSWSISRCPPVGAAPEACAAWCGEAAPEACVAWCGAIHGLAGGRTRTPTTARSLAIVSDNVMSALSSLKSRWSLTGSIDNSRCSARDCAVLLELLHERNRRLSAPQRSVLRNPPGAKSGRDSFESANSDSEMSSTL